MEISWTCSLQYGADSCINQGLKLRERRVSLTEVRKKKERRMTEERNDEKMQILTPSGSVSKQRFPAAFTCTPVVNNSWRTMVRPREGLEMYIDRDINIFVMYGACRPSLLIESTAFMISAIPGKCQPRGTMSCKNFKVGLEYDLNTILKLSN